MFFVVGLGERAVRGALKLLKSINVRHLNTVLAKIITFKNSKLHFEKTSPYPFKDTQKQSSDARKPT